MSTNVTLCSLVLFLAILVSLSESISNERAESKKCYSCTGQGKDSSCETLSGELHPSTALPCNRSSCTIVRVESVYKGEVSSFYRGCDNRFYQPECVVDKKYVTCFYSCSKSMCNNGTGVTTASFRSLRTKNSSSSTKHFPLFLIILLLII